MRRPAERLTPWVAGLGCALALALCVPASAAAQDEGGVAAFQGSWVDRALDIQYELGADLPLRNTAVVGTHNSFNSPAEMGSSVATTDANQSLDLTDQLDVDVRSLELDLHRYPSAEGGGYEPVVCHSFPGGAGCSTVKQLGPFLDEISAWLRRSANSEQVLLLYLEDDLDTLGSHNDAAAEIDDKLGDLVYAPDGEGCTEVDYDLARADVLADGKQVVIVSGCGKGEAWQSMAFSWENHLESRPFDFEDYPICGPDYTQGQYRARLIRYYEDSTRASRGSGSADDGIDPTTAAAMSRCGVDLIGLDQLEPTEGRLEGLVWSWAPDQPADGGCALSRVGGETSFATGRWISKRCGFLRRRVACRDGHKWKVPRERAGPRGAPRICRRHEARFAVPRTGFENQLLRDAMVNRGTSAVLLGIHARKGRWVPSDPRGD